MLSGIPAVGLSFQLTCHTAVPSTKHTPQWVYQQEYLDQKTWHDHGIAIPIMLRSLSINEFDQMVAKHITRMQITNQTQNQN